MQLIQTLTASTSNGSRISNQPAPEHETDAPFELVMSDGAEKSAEPAPIYPVAKEGSSQEEQLDPVSQQFPDSAGESNASEQQASAGVEEPEGEQIRVRSAGHTDVDSAMDDTPDQTEQTPAAEPKEASPMKAMIQGVSQESQISGTTHATDFNRTNKIKPSQVIFADSVALASVGQAQEQARPDLAPREAGLPTAQTNVAQVASVLPPTFEATGMHTSAALGAVQTDSGLQDRPLQSNRTNVQNGTALAVTTDGASTRNMSAEKVLLATQSVTNDQSGGSLSANKRPPKYMHAVNELPGQPNAPITATVRVVDQRQASGRTASSAFATSQNGSTAHQQVHTVKGVTQEPSPQLSSSVDSTEKTGDLPWEMRPTNGSQPAKVTAAIQRAELPQHVSQTIAEAFKRAPDKPIEIALNPAELGRVRMVMSTSETGIMVTVTADRGDTLDLMRRNIDDLGKSLSDLGFEDVSFAFDQGQQRTEQQEQAGKDDSATTDDALVMHHTTPTALTRVSTVAVAGIDMRL